VGAFAGLDAGAFLDFCAFLGAALGALGRFGLLHGSLLFQTTDYPRFFQTAQAHLEFFLADGRRASASAASGSAPPTFANGWTAARSFPRNGRAHRLHVVAQRIRTEMGFLDAVLVLPLARNLGSHGNHRPSPAHQIPGPTLSLTPPRRWLCLILPENDAVTFPVGRFPTVLVPVIRAIRNRGVWKFQTVSRVDRRRGGILLPFGWRPSLWPWGLPSSLELVAVGGAAAAGGRQRRGRGPGWWQHLGGWRRKRSPHGIHQGGKSTAAQIASAGWKAASP